MKAIIITIIFSFFITGYKYTDTDNKPCINILPYKGIDTGLTNFIYKELNKIYPNVVLSNAIPLSSRAYYSPRKRYRADTILLIQRESAKNNQYILGITNKDISTNKDDIFDWGVFGLAFGNSSIVSTHRLLKTNLKEQLLKTVLHELGHTQGLDHCIIKSCIMSDAKGKNNIDNEKGFCNKCKNFLIKKGFKV